jgi:hypothetical protein
MLPKKVAMNNEKKDLAKFLPLNTVFRYLILFFGGGRGRLVTKGNLHCLNQQMRENVTYLVI